MQGIAGARYPLAGALGNMEVGDIDGAMILFEAKDFEEAQRIAHNDPIVERGFTDARMGLDDFNRGHG